MTAATLHAPRSRCLVLTRLFGGGDHPQRKEMALVKQGAAKAAS